MVSMAWFIRRIENSSIARLNTYPYAIPYELLL